MMRVQEYLAKAAEFEALANAGDGAPTLQKRYRDAAQSYRLAHAAAVGARGSTSETMRPLSGPLIAVVGANAVALCVAVVMTIRLVWG